MLCEDQLQLVDQLTIHIAAIVETLPLLQKLALAHHQELATLSYRSKI